MGRPKPLLPLGDRTVLRHAVERILEAGVKDVVVVLGSEEAARTIRDLPVTVALNETPESDMAESARVGFGAVDPSSSGVLIHLSDHPLVAAETFRTLLAAQAREPERIIIPVYEGRRGHPTLFPLHILKEELHGGLTLRDLAYREPRRVRLVNVPDEGVALDMDTPEDYEKILRKTPPESPRP